MNPFGPLSAVASSTLEHVRAWPVRTQQGARRNAMVASTALAARRAEREEVDAYFAGLQPREQVLRVAVHR
jgi:phage gp37-like protein